MKESSKAIVTSAPNWTVPDASALDAVPFVRAPEAPATSEIRQTRTRRLFHALSSAIASKGIMIVSNALTIPIAIRYLGGERFGIWTIISTALAMLLVLDLGVANSLTNFISEAYARDNREYASQYTTTALLIMTFVAILIGIAGAAAWHLFDWKHIFNLSSHSEVPEVATSVAVAFVIFLVDLPSRLAIKILGGYQELRTASLFTALGSVGNLVIIVALVQVRASLPAMVAGSSAALVGSDLICLLWLTFFSKPWLRPRIEHFSRAAARRLMQLGVEFFLIQIAGLVVFNSDNLVITHYLGPAEVSRYSVAWRLVGYAAVLQTLIGPAVWPAFSEAFDRGDHVWVRSAFRRITAITMSVALLMAIVFAVFGRWLIRIWATDAAVPAQSLMLLMCLWVVISTFMNNTATVLASSGRTRVQAWCSVAAAAVNLALSIWLVQRIGAAGVILGTITSYVAVLMIPQSLETWKVLSSSPPLHGAVVEK